MAAVFVLQIFAILKVAMNKDFIFMLSHTHNMQIPAVTNRQDRQTDRHRQTGESTVCCCATMFSAKFGKLNFSKPNKLPVGKK